MGLARRRPGPNNKIMHRATKPWIAWPGVLCLGLLIAQPMWAFLQGLPLQAALAPKSPEQLEEQTTSIIEGKVLTIRSKTRWSKIETAWGLHRDRIYTLTLQVTTCTKGEAAQRHPGDRGLATLFAPPAPARSPRARPPSQERRYPYRLSHPKQRYLDSHHAQWTNTS